MRLWSLTLSSWHRVQQAPQLPVDEDQAAADW